MGMEIPWGWGHYGNIMEVRTVQGWEQRRDGGTVGTGTHNCRVGDVGHPLPMEKPTWNAHLESPFWDPSLRSGLAEYSHNPRQGWEGLQAAGPVLWGP